MAANVENGDVSRESTPETSCLQKVSTTIITTLEDGFERLGLLIGKHPWRFIAGCIIVCSLTSLGLIAFNEVEDRDKLWVPLGADVLDDKDWVAENFPSTFVRDQIIGTSSNILTPTGLAALLDIYQESLTLVSGSTSLNDICIKSGSNCLVYSILELWSYDDATIRALSPTQILSDVNTISESQIYGNDIDLDNYLGEITRDNNGDVTGAKAAAMTWILEGNEDMKDRTNAWETELIDLGKKGHADLSNTYVFASRSWQDESGKALTDDVFLLTVGYCIVAVFVTLVLGKVNLMEHKIWLTVGGFFCIGLSTLVSIGLSSAFQQDYGPLQSVLPFLLLGIGVDDMFVIMGALRELPPEEQEFDIPRKVSKVLRHAGVSVTVTSLTDFVAFIIGATTIIPALRSFCVYAAMGILALFSLQVLFFTSCLVINLQLMEAGRDACCCMVKHGPDYKPSDCSQKELIPLIFKKGVAKIVSKLPFKIIVVIGSLGLFGANLYGLVKLEQYFDPFWFIPSDSYATEYLEARDKYFPDDGASGFVYCGNVNYWSLQSEFEGLDTSMQSNRWISNGTTDSWFSALTSWLNNTADASVISQLDANRYPLNEANFISLAHQMATTEVPRTNPYLIFSSSNTDIAASRFPYKHVDVDDSSDEIDAMDSIRNLVKDQGLSSQCFPYSEFYLTWETNKVIQRELYRNLGLALVCVFLVTLILIANLWTSLMVFVSVVFTLVDVAGTMHFWGLTIDTVTSIVLVLSIGLAVDYSAHIGHMFMTVTGTRQYRTGKTLEEMGPPVFYGGFSTFLAFITLARSTSYVFSTFFKVNFLVILYGLFHGLIFLPVLLSWIGPAPYPTATSKVHKQEHHKESKQGEVNPAFNSASGETSANKSTLPPIRQNHPNGIFVTGELTEMNPISPDSHKA